MNVVNIKKLNHCFNKHLKSNGQITKSNNKNPLLIKIL